MLKEKYIDIVISGSTLKWYQNKGYKVPTHKRQLWVTKKGKRVKHGTKTCVAKGTVMKVAIKDLPPASNVNIPLICPACGINFQTTYGAYLKKHSDNCSTCVKKKIKGDGSHNYWVSKLITNNPNASCDISKETDKRFLILHHLDSKSSGGRNIESNYVVLSANYHMAFHVALGGTGVPCTKAQYNEFKKEEQL